ncbi:MAG: CAP domain-containing protein [Planctomycetes bacterium]|nr:CAP domain-containing protein [Planctomycetota bacterium]
MLLQILLTLPLLSSSLEIDRTIAVPAALHQEGEATEVELLQAALIKAKSIKARDAAFDQLMAIAEFGFEAEEAISEALAHRWLHAWSVVTKGGFLRKLEKLAEKRTELDETRKAALALIFDEQRYFYPYTQPQVSAKKAAQYPAVKREVLALAKEVRDVWARSPKVKVPKATKAALLEIQWILAHKNLVQVDLVLPEQQPEWLQYLPANTDSDTITFTNFAMTAVESVRLLRDAKALAYNERVWQAQKSTQKGKHKKKRKRAPADPKAHNIALEIEREQVRITNRYRMTMGHPAVTWDATLQAATHMHSDYMAQTGEFSHYEKDPARKTPFDRMGLLGYDQGASENCSNGRGHPQDAHEGWMGSSGHHRNLLMRSHLQMASASNGPYWTQNFGRGQDVEKQL